MKPIYLLKRALFFLWAQIKYPTLFWKLFNKESIHAFDRNIPKLSETQQMVLEDLEETGIALTSLDELFDTSVLGNLQKHVKHLEKTLDTKTKKSYLHDYWQKRPPISLGDPIMSLSLSSKILDVVNSYLGMYSQLAFFFLQKTEVRNGEDREYSQRWHRDPQEQKFCKVFIYLNDVDESAGPFTYIPNSVSGKKYGSLFPQKPPAGSYPKNGAVEDAIPTTDYKIMTGKAGTVIFCDTTGLHRGGYATEKERIMATFAYGSQTFRENISYTCKGLPFNSLSPQAKAAVEKQCKRTNSF